MMRTAQTIAITALVFVALSGLVGGVPLIARPDGSVISLPLSLLQYSPFHSYLIPGVILFVAVGLLGSAALWIALRRRANYAWWIVLEGCVLLGWIVVEMIMLRLVMWAQIVYALVALLLIVTGMILARAPGEPMPVVNSSSR